MVPGNRLDVEAEEFIGQPRERRGRSLSLGKLLEGYRLTAQSEGKSPNTIAIIEASLGYLSEFLAAGNLSDDVKDIGVEELRRFIIYLQERPRFANHPFTPPQEGHLSGHTINGYLRALRSFWSWLEREMLTIDNPFTRLRIQKPPEKIFLIFTEEQLLKFFSTIDTASRTGYRDYAICLILLDTGIRCSELINLRLVDVNLDSRLLKVWGKGSKERSVPIGAKAQKAIWKYQTYYRPEPAIPRFDYVFLTHDGRPLTKDRLEAIVERYGKKAGITGVRVSPHTFRHTAIVMLLRNDCNVFSLQRITGHSRVENLMPYVNLVQSDVSRAHQRSSPVDNLDIRPAKPHKGTAKTRDGQSRRELRYRADQGDG